MATTNVPPAASDPSMTELRAMLGDTTTAAVTTDAKPATSETPVEKSTEEHHQAATETAEKQPNPETTEEEPLPEGVQKRIAKEAEKAARIQSEIDRAVSDRKAKEAQLEKLKVGEKGSDPVKKPESPTDSKPKRPTLGEAGHENEGWEAFAAREAAYEDQRDAWLQNEAIRKFREGQASEAAQKAQSERWDAAVEKHGKDFPALMDSARALAPEGLQVAISSLDNWDTVAVHLAKNPTQLQELAAVYQQNPTKAIATLGRIEAALSSKETKTAATTEKPLPAPPAKVGGSASASGQDLQDTIEKGSMSQLRAVVGKLRK